jgi:hypothetical protein
MKPEIKYTAKYSVEEFYGELFLSFYSLAFAKEKYDENHWNLKRLINQWEISDGVTYDYDAHAKIIGINLHSLFLELQDKLKAKDYTLSIRVFKMGDLEPSIKIRCNRENSSILESLVPLLDGFGYIPVQKYDSEYKLNPHFYSEATTFLTLGVP